MQKGSRIVLALVLASLVGIGTLILLIIDTVTHVPDFKELRSKVVVPIKLANKEKSQKEMGPQAKGWVSLGQVSNHVLMAVIASEDTSFFSHKGVDYHELTEAIKKDWEEKKWARGGSTLTQQVVKNVYLNNQKTLWRKFKEFIWAKEMEKVLSKSEILNFYVNMAEWGPGIYGIREAAQHYFNVHPSVLTAKQAAFLAMLLPTPIRYHTYYETKKLTPWASKRVGQILKVMNRMGFVEDGVYEAALQEKLWGVTGEIGGKGLEENLPAEDTSVVEEEPSLLNPPIEKLKAHELEQEKNDDPDNENLESATEGQEETKGAEEATPPSPTEPSSIENESNPEASSD